VPLAHVVAAGGALDLDDARAQVCEEARAVRAGQDAREVENHEAMEGSDVFGHRRSIAGLFGQLCAPLEKWARHWLTGRRRSRDAHAARAARSRQPCLHGRLDGLAHRGAN
jgi:hypothetical protein